MFEDMRLADIENLMLQGGLILMAGFVFYIIYDLAKKSNAGRFGTFVLFGALGLGLIAFLIKTIAVAVLEK